MFAVQDNNFYIIQAPSLLCSQSGTIISTDPNFSLEREESIDVKKMLVHGLRKWSKSISQHTDFSGGSARGSEKCAEGAANVKWNDTRLKQTAL